MLKITTNARFFINVILLILALLLVGCANRESLSGKPVYRLSVPSLMEALQNAELEPVELDGKLYLGFSSLGEHAWYSMQVIDEREEVGIKTSLARLTQSHRYRPYLLHGEPVEVIKKDEVDAFFLQMFDWVIPAEPNIGFYVAADGDASKEGVFIWRDTEGRVQAADSIDQALHITILGGMSGKDLFLRSLSLIERGDKGRLLEHNPDEMGAIGWIYVPAGGQDIMFIQTPIDNNGEHTPLTRVTLKSLDHLVLRSHFLTLLKNPVSTLRRLLGHGEDAVVSLFRRGPSQKYPETPLAQGASMDMEEWEKTLDFVTRTRKYPGTLDFLIGGEAFFTTLKETFEEANERIDIRTYIFDNDAFAVRVADTLKEISERIPVRVMMDDLGSIMAGMSVPPNGYPANFSPPNDIAKYLKKDSRIKVRRVGNPWLTGDHAKLTVVDRKTAFVGGMNYGEEYRYHWHDMMAKVEGPIVWRLQKEFESAWAYAGPGGDLAYLIRRLSLPNIDAQLTEQYPVPIRVLQTRTGKNEILQAHLAAIDRAQRYIYIATPYFTEPSVMNRLIAARARGVDVRVVLPDQGNHGVMNSANVLTANQLLDGGVRVFMYPGMSHVKAAVFDGWASFGSANFDRLSMKVNQEINLATSHPETVQKLLDELFMPHFGMSEEVIEELPWNWSDSFAGAILAKPL